MTKEKDSEKLFRFTAVSSLKSELQRGRSLSEAISLVLKNDYYTPEGRIKSFSARTLYRWYRAFEKDGAKGLSNKKKYASKKRRLSEQELKFIKKTKEDDPLASVPEVIKQGRLQDELPSDISRTTVYRACKKMNLPLLRSSGPENQDMRRFSHPHRMVMVLCDGKHFRAGETRRKRVAFIFIDDCTRYVLHHVVGTSENTKLFLKGLYELILKYGLMQSLYLDKGPGFKSGDTAEVVSSLNISLIMGKTRYPEGHGKIERFNRTIKKDLLRGLCRESVDPELSSLNLRIKHYVEDIYNKTPHSSLDGKTPAEAFTESDYPLTFPRDLDFLKKQFVLKEERKVSKDNVIPVDGVSLELPRGYAGRNVTIFRHLIKNEIYIFHDGSRIHLHKVDAVFNANNKRGDVEKCPVSPRDVKLASDISFDRKMKSIVDKEGNYFEEEKC